jgi:hypothetical protein
MRKASSAGSFSIGAPHSGLLDKLIAPDIRRVGDNDSRTWNSTHFDASNSLMHPIVLTWIYFTVVYAVTAVQDRYHFPSHPFIAMLAAMAIMAAVSIFQHSSIGTRA